MITKIPDRSKQPKIIIINNVKLLKPQTEFLDNGIPCYSINTGTQDVVKIVCRFNAGNWFQNKKLVAFATAKMITEGTKNKSASELASFFDSYGAYISTEADNDNAFISLYTLNKHLPKLLPVFAEIIKESDFPKHELNVLMNNAKQEYLVSLQRVNFLARNKFTEQLFGKNHPYGQAIIPDDYDKIITSDVADFHRNFYNKNLKIVLSGLVNKNTISLLNKYFGAESFNKKIISRAPSHKINTNNKKKIFIPKENALQSGVRIGKILFTKKHPDYLGMSVLNTILGGYFGSRLMTNIREDKGYTYGIGSGLLSLKNEGFFYIASEVNADNRENAVNEIYKEIKKLQQQLVPKEELELVKNYMLGSFLRSIDGPFPISDRFINIIDFEFDFNEYYNRYVKTIKQISSAEIIELAKKYFKEDSFFEAVVGK